MEQFSLTLVIPTERATSPLERYVITFCLASAGNSLKCHISATFPRQRCVFIISNTL